MTFIVGAYTATYSASAIGQTEDGFHLIEQIHSEDITTDESGRAPLNAILLGQTVEVRIGGYMEYDLIKAALYTAVTAGQPLSNVGVLAVSLAASLVLTPVTGTTAKTLDGSKVYTFTKAIVLSDIDTMLRNGVRRGPVTFRCFPDSGTTPANKAYTWA